MMFAKIILSFLCVCMVLGFPDDRQAQSDKTADVVHTFWIDPGGDGQRLRVDQLLTKSDSSDCLIRLVFHIKDQTVTFQDKFSLFPLPLQDLDLCKAEIKRMGAVETLEYIVGVGVSGIQSRKRIIFDRVRSKVVVLHYAEGGVSGMGDARPLSQGEYLLPLLEASYVLYGYEGYGPPLYSSYIVRFTDQGVDVRCLLNPAGEGESLADKTIKQVRNFKWCRFFYKKQMREYQETLQKANLSGEQKAEIQKLMEETKKFCGEK